MAVLETQFRFFKGEYFVQMFGERAIDKYKIRYDFLVMLFVYKYLLIE